MEEQVPEEMITGAQDIFLGLGPFGPILLILGMLGFGYFIMNKNKQRNQASKKRRRDYNVLKDLKEAELEELNARSIELVDTVDNEEIRAKIERERIERRIQVEREQQKRIKEIDTNDASNAGKNILDQWRKL